MLWIQSSLIHNYGLCHLIFVFTLNFILTLGFKFNLSATTLDDLFLEVSLQKNITINSINKDALHLYAFRVLKYHRDTAPTEVFEAHFDKLIGLLKSINLYMAN